MVRTDWKQNIFLQYLIWQFFDVPKNILVGWRNFLLFNLNYFSLPLLLKTFFSPWRRFRWYYPRGFDIGKYLETFFSNLISRFLGAGVRIVLIFFGLLVEIFLILGGFFLFLGWLILPFLLIWGIWFGFKIIL